MTEPEDVERLKKHVEQLGEHFDTVQIFVSRHMPAKLDGTVSVNQGAGNWNARYGQVKRWITWHEESERRDARGYEK